MTCYARIYEILYQENTDKTFASVSSEINPIFHACVLDNKIWNMKKTFLCPSESTTRNEEKKTGKAVNFKAFCITRKHKKIVTEIILI